MQTVHLEAPAKVNLRLDVLGKRTDGYHDVRMVMQRIDLSDALTISLSQVPGIRVVCGRKGIPDGPGNIAWRAADALLKLTDGSVGVDIAITKRIPVAAGLGGGSSDAASVLMGLNKLLGLGLGREQLMTIGVTLGADVPFFIFQRPALAEGIGERLAPLEEIPPVWLVIINPRISVSTAWVYQNLQLTSGREFSSIPLFYRSAADIAAIMANDLEAVTIGRFPLIARIKERLMAAGACAALMSGSGSTVFGLFADEETARRALAEIDVVPEWFSTVVPTLS